MPFPLPSRARRYGAKPPDATTRRYNRQGNVAATEIREP
jgi:hypothetical protein